MVNIIVDENKCDLCGLCVEYCPAYVFRIEDKKLVVESSQCKECYGCIPLCPKRAITIVDEDP